MSVTIDVAPNTPFCKFCFDSGKPDYNNHWLRTTTDKNSSICCPELMKIKCRYCKLPGHTISYCQVLREKEQRASLSGITKHSKPSISADGFVTVTSSKSKSVGIRGKATGKASPISIIGMFAGLSCDDNECDECDADNAMELGESWRVVEELVVESPYLQAVKFGVRAAPQLVFEYKRGSTSWADQCE